MRAIVLDSYGGSELLQPRQMPDPRPESGQLLVRVRAAAVNPLDWKIRQGQLSLVVRPRFPYVPGCDVAGEVAAVGPRAGRFQPGDAVVGFIPPQRGGAYAELALLGPGAVAAKPASLSFAEAATLPVAACTALQALRDLGRLAEGGRVLILGGAGGVGHFAVQIAKALGATVTATCGTANQEFVHALGADRVIDYSRQAVTGQTERYDVVFDSVAKSSFLACRPLLAPGGTYVTTLPAPDVIAWRLGEPLFGLFCGARRARMIMVRPNQEDLALLGQWADQGRLKPKVSLRYPLEHAAAAQQTSQAGHARGKIVIEP